MTERAKKYLSDVLIAIELIEAFIEDVPSFNAYETDFKTQSAVERQLGIIGEAINKFTKEESSIILKVFGPLQYTGRLSLTNYILYSVLFTSLMYSYGFGKFMSFAPFELVLMAVLTFIALLFLCKLYLKHFRFGPLEWLWRKLTY